MFTVPDERSHRLSVTEDQKTKPKANPDVATEILFGKSSAIPLTEKKIKKCILQKTRRKRHRKSEERRGIQDVRYQESTEMTLDCIKSL